MQIIVSVTPTKDLEMYGLCKTCCESSWLESKWRWFVFCFMQQKSLSAVTLLRKIRLHICKGMEDSCPVCLQVSGKLGELSSGKRCFRDQFFWQSTVIGNPEGYNDIYLDIFLIALCDLTVIVTLKHSALTMNLHHFLANTV